LIAFLAVAALVLGYAGFFRFFTVLGEPRSPLDVFYLTLQLFVLESGSVWGPVPWELQVARLLAPAVAGYAAVGALLLLFQDHFGRIRVRFFRRHVVICGLGRKGLLLTRSLRGRGDRVVVIEEDAENDLIQTARAYRAIVLIGDARDQQILRAAGVAQASHLVAVSGDDGVNAEVAVQAGSLIRDQRTTRLSCLAHIVDPDLCNLLRMQETGRQAEKPFRLDFFNVFEAGARALLNDFPVTGPGGGDQVPEGHIVVVGLGRFGESLVLQAAREWHTNSATAEDPFRVTVVDQEADRRTQSLLARYPWLGQVCDLDTVDVTFDSGEFADAPFLFDADGHLTASSIFICVDDDSRGISAALTLHRRVRSHGIPVVVRTVHGTGLASLLQEDRVAGGEFAGLHAFGLLDRTCNAELLFGGVNEILARAMHESYVRDRKDHGETVETNPALVPWGALGENLRESNRAQAAHIGVKLRAAGCELSPLTTWDAGSFTFEPDEVERLAVMEHDRWMAERKRTGWTSGPRDPDKSRSPFLVPWSDLGEEVRELDRLFIRGLPRFLAKAGFQIVRVRGGSDYGGRGRDRG